MVFTLDILTNFTVFLKIYDIGIDKSYKVCYIYII